MDEQETTIGEELVRDVLMHLYDNAYLLQHPLLPLLVKRHLPDPLARAQQLRSLIIEAIHSLAPPAPVVAKSKEWRPYGVLILRYVDRLSDERIQRDLAISERQLFRDLKAGIALLTIALRAQAAGEAEAEKEDALASSLQGVGLRLERLDLNALGSQVLPLVQGLSSALGKAVHLQPAAAEAIAVADVALSRQALITALSYALQHASGDVCLQVVSTEETQALVLRFQGISHERLPTPVDANLTPRPPFPTREGGEVPPPFAEEGLGERWDEPNPPAPLRCVQGRLFPKGAGGALPFAGERFPLPSQGRSRGRGSPPFAGERSFLPEALGLTQQLLEQQGGSLRLEEGEQGERRISLHWGRFQEPAILIVDDDVAMLRLFGRYLAGHGYRVVSSGDGSQAVKLASENRVRLVILDVMMRDMDGWTVLQQLKTDPATCDLPVLVCSVINEPQLALTLGATALLRKPVRQEQLLSTVMAIVGI